VSRHCAAGRRFQVRAPVPVPEKAMVMVMVMAMAKVLVAPAVVAEVAAQR